MSLQPIREEIDRIDRQIIALFMKRMECSQKVAEYKRENGMSILNTEREQVVLDKAAQEAGIYGDAARQLYTAILELSRSLQHDLLDSGEALKHEICAAETELPCQDSKVVCFGVPGTYAHQAAIKAFPDCTPDFCASFQDVFSAIRSGEADFGIVPIENSSAGSVMDVYDLMLKYRFHIALAVDIPVNHVLAAKKGAVVSALKQVYSHPQALTQCSDFFRSRRHLSAESYLSTAAAAKMVSESDDTAIAAICSEQAAQKYGLEILMRGFQNAPHNTTRFIVISQKLYIPPDAEKISLCFSLPHTTGSLYSILCRFAANGLNLTKIESRPMPQSSFEYLFYLDFTGNISHPKTLQLMGALSEELQEFSFLGNFREIRTV